MDRGKRSRAFLVAAFAMFNGEPGAYRLVRANSPAAIPLVPELRRLCADDGLVACIILSVSCATGRGCRSGERGKSNLMAPV